MIRVRWHIPGFVDVDAPPEGVFATTDELVNHEFPQRFVHDYAARQIIDPPAVWCSMLCAAYEEAWSVRTGWTDIGKRIIEEVNGEFLDRG